MTNPIPDWRVLLVIALISFPTLGGGISAGGTGFVLFKDRAPELIEYYLANPDRKPGKLEPIPATAALKALHFAHFEYKKTNAFKLAWERLRLWSAHEPKLTKAIASVLLHTLNFFVIEKPVKEVYEIYWPENVPKQPIASPITFDFTLGPVIYRHGWNLADELVHAGAYIHEALRHFQRVSDLSLTNKAVQEITATLMLKDPSAETKLSSDAYLGEPLRQALEHSNWKDLLNFSHEVRQRLFLAQLRQVITDVRREAKPYPKLAARVEEVWSELEKECGDTLKNPGFDMAKWHNALCVGKITGVAETLIAAAAEEKMPEAFIDQIVRVWPVWGDASLMWKGSAVLAEGEKLYKTSGNEEAKTFGEGINSLFVQKAFYVRLTRTRGTDLTEAELAELAQPWDVADHLNGKKEFSREETKRLELTQPKLTEWMKDYLEAYVHAREE